VRPVPEDVVYGIARIDASGRICERAIITALGWAGGDRLSGLFAAFFFLSQYFQNVRHATPVFTGLAFLAMAVPFAVSSQFKPRGCRNGGAASAPCSPRSGWPPRACCCWPRSGQARPAGPRPVRERSRRGHPRRDHRQPDGVSEHAAGVAGGLITTVQQVGGVIGLAALSSLSTAVAQGRLAAWPAGLDGASGPAAVAALMAGYHWVFLAAVPLTAVALLLSLVALRPQELRAAEGRGAPSEQSPRPVR
jgi:hypothetical protein